MVSVRMSLLAEMNGFKRSDSGVYQAPSAEHFAYTDGESSEALLAKILSNTQDLSSESQALQDQIVDWPSEYHLSIARANLLRPLDLSNVKRVLELGCGCGSITRYIGEHTHIQIDSIEGSPSRAALAAMRCRDLDNVTISTANFNQVAIPENYYDLILYVGVTEYAGRFSEHERDQDALQDLLAIAKKASNNNGVTVIAIENRVGLKYLMGACEDHYAVPYIGLDDYPQSTGVRTYTKSEWQTQLKTADFKVTQFAYPFPDYKIPSLVINDSAIDIGAHDQGQLKNSLLDALGRVKSRCYIADFHLGEQEAKIWQGHLEAQTLGQHSNSFLIFSGDDQQAIDQLCNFSVKEYQEITHAYLAKPEPAHRDVIVSGLSNEEQAQQQLALVSAQDHANALQNKVDLMTGSIGWRALNVLRRLFGKPPVR